MHMERFKLALQCSQYVFFVLGLAALGYCGSVLLSANLYQSRQKLMFQSPPPSQKLALPPADKIVRTGAPLGLLEIPRVGFSAVILEGADASSLQRGIGHIPGTPLPGRPGNVAIAGHRDTFFRALKDVRGNDVIGLTTLYGHYKYRVDWTKIVGPDETSVLQGSRAMTLTLITCYPFYFVGAAPKRFIVRADRIAD